MRYVVVLLLLAAVVPARSAELQYDVTTFRVTGFAQRGAIAPVPQRGVVTVADTLLETVVQPAGCALSLADWTHLLTVSLGPPVTITMDPVECFGGQVVSTKAELDTLVVQELEKRVPNVRSFTREQCPTAGISPACDRLRALITPRVPALEALDTEVLQPAATVRERVP